MTRRATPVEPSSTGSDAVDPDSQLSSALRIATMRLARRLRAERSDETLGLSQLSALATLDRHETLSPTALADLERIQPPSMTRVIAALEERGFIERRPHESDRRQSVLAISKSGHDLVIEDRRRRQAWLAAVIDSLTDEERSILLSAVPVLEKLVSG